MPCMRGMPPMITAVLWRKTLDRGGGIRGRRCLGWCRLQRREEVLHEPHALECHTDRLLAALPRRMVHHGTTHMGHRRDGGQFHQPFPLKIAVDPFGDAFVAPEGVDQRLIGHSLARVAGTAFVDLGEERQTVRLPRVECRMVVSSWRASCPQVAVWPIPPVIIPSVSGSATRGPVSASSGLFPRTTWRHVTGAASMGTPCIGGRARPVAIDRPALA